MVSLVGYRGDVRAWAQQHGVEAKDHWIRQGYVPGLPKHSLVFPHVEGGRVRYFSTRLACLVREEEAAEGGAFVVWDAVTDEATRYPFSDAETRREAERQARDQGKRHYNLPRELVGDKRPCWNSRAIPGRSDVVIVEG